MPAPSKPFDFRKRVAYDGDAKEAFHRTARRQLKLLAAALGLPTGGFDLRSNKGGIAVSGEVTLHADHLYVQCASPELDGIPGCCFEPARTAKTTMAVRTISHRLIS